MKNCLLSFADILFFTVGDDTDTLWWDWFIEWNKFVGRLSFSLTFPGKVIESVFSHFLFIMDTKVKRQHCFLLKKIEYTF